MSNTNSHGATARALRHARSPQRVRRAQATLARRHSESASTRTISAEGSPSSRQVRMAPQRERVGTHNLRRGFAEFAESKSSSHGATVSGASTRRISTEGLARARQTCTAPQQERFDANNLRRGLAETNLHSAAARALTHNHRRAQDKFARSHSKNASTRPISAKGSLSSRNA